MSDRPTPETESHFPSSRHKDDSWVVSCEIGLIRNLERERDEARENAQHWCDMHILAVKDFNQARQLALELRDALDQCREDSIQLKAEWKWKRKNAGPRNERDYFEVECHIEMADGVLAKAKEVLT